MLLSQSNMQKLKEAKAELVQERSHTKELESQYKTKVDLQVQDIDALRRRMQQVSFLVRIVSKYWACFDESFENINIKQKTIFDC